MTNEPCINWPCAKGAGHAGPCGTSRDEQPVQPSSNELLSQAWDDIDSLMEYAFDNGFHELGYDPARVISDEMERVAQELADLKAAGSSAPEPCTELEEWRRLKTDRHAAHIACLRGVIALHPDDALHVGGTSRNELDALRASQPPSAKQLLDGASVDIIPADPKKGSYAGVTWWPKGPKVNAPANTNATVFSAGHCNHMFDMLVVTTAYESGFGHGLHKDDLCNPYTEGGYEHHAYAIGYE